MLREVLVRALFAAVSITAVLAQANEDAMRLYNKGVQLLETGKGDAARQAFQTIIDKYPTDAYAKLAHEGMDKPLVASITYKELKGISEREIRKEFELANARLVVGRPFDVAAVDQARTMLAQMMIKRKLK